jgi:hypothetical protein
MHRWTRRLSAALLTTMALAPPLAAQIDYRNLDHGRPLRVTDAVAVERYAFEVSLPWRFATGGGASAHVLVPEIEYGIARNLVVGIELELAADGDVLGESHAALSVFYNALRETPGAPALSFNLEVGQPTAAALLSDVAATLTGIATRSIGRSRVHANVALTAGASDESSWFAGVALDHTLFRTSTLVGAELLAADRAATGGSRWALGAGLRRQLAPTLVLQAGIRRWLDGDPGANEITLGLSHAFAIAGLMPGRSTR